MAISLWILLIPGAIVAAFVLVLVYYYNRVRVLANRIGNAWSQIDVQLKKRADLVPNLVNTVKGYMTHEKNAIKMVTEARERMLGAGNAKDRMKADGQLAKALKTIFALAENYPNLKASENFQLLQEQLEGVENKVAYSRQFYNDSVLEFNNLITTFPGSLFAGGRTAREYFEATEAERAPVKVEF